MKYKTVIWDFNGTLLSDMEISIQAMNTVLQRRNLPLIPSLNAFQDVFGFPVKDYYARLGIDFEKEPYKVSADEWVELYSEKMYDAPLIDGVKDALDSLRRSGISQIVLSASEKNRLTAHLEKLGIADYFDHVYGSDNVYAKGKSEIASELAKDDSLFPCVLIGDTDHDYFCAQSIGCDCILFSGGFMSENRLKKLSAPVFGSLCEIIETITEID